VSQKRVPLSVIGAGLGRTGTTSLKFALEELGLAPCHHMTELIRWPHTAQAWERAADGEAVDWDEILADYRATTDWPACHFYQQLAAKYPEAKVILTVRDPARWFESTQATIFSAEMVASDGPMAGFFRKAIMALFDARMHDREHLIAVYQRHNDEVRRAVPPQRLLIYDVTQGWEPLCRFLDVPVPERAFPRANTTEDFQGKAQERLPQWNARG
jgi:hypothetical protein